MTAESQKDFLGALDGHWDNYRRQFKAGRQEISEESIHDLRVAARRLLAQLSILRCLDVHPRVMKIQRFLKRQLDQLDQLRDAQVLLADTTQGMESLPQLAPFQAYLLARSSDLADAARKDLGASRPSDLEKRVKEIRRVAKKHSKDKNLLDQLLRAVDQAHSKTGQMFGKLNANDPVTIHHVRIAFKKFRYMIETIQPLLRDYPEAHLDRMHDYQDAMGRVHDMSVFLDRLHEYEASLPTPQHGDASAFDSKPIEAYYRKRLDDLIRVYFERKDEFNIFWRAASDQPFPWEKSHDSVHRASRNRRTTEQQQQRRRRQPAASDRRRAQKDAPDRARAEGTGSEDRPDPDQSVPPGG